MDFTDEEMLEQETELYQPAFQTKLTTGFMPTKPVDPELFVNIVSQELLTKKATVNDDTQDVMRDLCKVFNFNIECNNTENTYTIESYVFPAQTGVGKSVALQVYVSLLKKESSLIIVANVSEAISYCEYINELSSDPDYARCYYRVTDDNPKSDVRCSTKSLSKSRCIVLTHRMFQLVNEVLDINLYNLYKSKKRDLIVVDERISLYEKTEFTKYKIKEMTDKLLLSSKTVDDPDELQQVEKLHKAMKSLWHLPKIFKKRLEGKLQPTELIFQSKIEKYFSRYGLTVDDLIKFVEKLLSEKAKALYKELKLIGGLGDDSYFDTIEKKITEEIELIDTMLKQDIFFYQDNYSTAFMSINNIAQKLGVSVVLDATSNVNEYYKVANRYWGSIGLIETKRFRKYQNMNVHVAKGFNQSRYAIYKNKDEKFKQELSQMYLSYAYNVLNSEKDKMLIISHKVFKGTLVSENVDERIVFTSWGNHVGKNNWSDCNKVMVVGWYTLTQIEHISNFYAAVGKIDEASYFIDEYVLKVFENTRLVDDLVQGIMRSNARVIDTEDSDCKQTDVYLFQKDDTSDHIIDGVIGQFPECNKIDWQPVGNPIVKKKTKSQRNADVIIEYLVEKSTDNQTYLRKNVMEEKKVDPGTFSRTVNTDYFKEELLKHNMELKKKDGKSEYFDLQIK